MIFSYKKFFITLLLLLGISFGSVVFAQDNPATTPKTTNTVTLEPSSTPTSTCPPEKPDCYQLFSGFSNILGKSFENIDSSQGLGGFMNGIISTVIKFGSVGAVIMIMVYGTQLWTTDDNSEKRKILKSKMIGTIGGFLLMLTTFIILRTINPDLLNLTPRIDDVAIKSGATLSTEDFQKITGEPLKTAGEYDQLIKDTAQKFNSDYCALRVIVQNESRGDPRIVGQDENVPSSSVPSRLAFINSQQKYSGATFIKDNGLISTATFCNDAAGCLGKVPKPNDPDLGLDWRFSKGIGLTQITFYPDDYSLFTKDGYTPKTNNKHVVPSRSFSFNGQTMTVSASDVFKPEKNLEISAKLWNEGVKKCNTPQGAFYTYMCGSCSCAGQYPKTEVAERVSQYNECKKTN